MTALLRTVLGKALFDQRRALLGWAVAMLALPLLMASFYPTVAAQAEEFQRLIESYPPQLTAFFGDFSDFTTPAGFLRAELFSFLLPILFLVYAIGRGADAIAGEEERGALELILVHPVSRRQVLLEKGGALAIGTTVLALVLFVGLAIGTLAFGLGVPMLRLAAASLMIALLSLVFGGIALAVGAATGRKSVAVATAAALAAVSYVVEAFGGLVDALAPMQRASPWHHYAANIGLGDGLDLAAALLLATLAAVALAIGAWRFEGRDVAT